MASIGSREGFGVVHVMTREEISDAIGRSDPLPIYSYKSLCGDL